MGIIKSLGAVERSLNKDQIVALAEANVREVVESGKYDMLKVFAELKRYELYMKTVLEKTKEVALDLALELGEKSLEVDNAKITIYKRTVYDFSHDPKWASLQGDLEFLTELRKKREALLKELAPGEVREVVDEQSGEVEELVAPVAETKLGLIVKL